MPPRVTSSGGVITTEATCVMSKEYRTAPEKSPGAVFRVSGAVGRACGTGLSGEAGQRQDRLVTTTNNVVTSAAAEAAEAVARRQRRRSARYAARDVLRKISELKRVRGCGTPIRPGGTVDLRVSTNDDGNRHAGFEGLGVCGSVWACPVCSAKIQAGRRDELQQLIEWAESQGLTPVFGTMTLRHNRKQPLEQVWGGLSHAFRRVAQDRVVRRLRTKHGFAGYVRVVEVTHGRNGWHPHIHTVYLFDFGDMDDYQRECTLLEIEDAEFSVWQRSAKDFGLGKPLRERYRLQLVSNSVADYLSKAAYSGEKLGFEMAGNTLKEGYSKSRTPWQILQDVVETYNADDVDLWREYEAVSRGRKMLTWSRGLKDAAGVNDPEDEEIAAQAEGTAEDRVAVIADFRRDLLWRPLVTADLLTVAENGDLAAIRAFCEEWGVELKPVDWGPAELDRERHERMLRERARMNTTEVFDGQEETPDEERGEVIAAYFAAQDAARAAAQDPA